MLQNEYLKYLEVFISLILGMKFLETGRKPMEKIKKESFHSNVNNTISTKRPIMKIHKFENP